MKDLTAALNFENSQLKKELDDFLRQLKLNMKAKELN